MTYTGQAVLVFPIVDSPRRPGTSFQSLFSRGLGGRRGHSDLSRFFEGTRTPFGDGGLTAPYVEAYSDQSSSHSGKKNVTFKGSIQECVMGFPLHQGLGRL